MSSKQVGPKQAVKIAMPKPSDQNTKGNNKPSQGLVWNYQSGTFMPQKG